MVRRHAKRGVSARLRDLSVRAAELAQSVRRVREASNECRSERAFDCTRPQADTSQAPVAG